MTRQLLLCLLQLSLAYEAKLLEDKERDRSWYNLTLLCALLFSSQFTLSLFNVSILATVTGYQGYLYAFFYLKNEIE